MQNHISTGLELASTQALTPNLASTTPSTSTSTSNAASISSSSSTSNQASSSTIPLRSTGDPVMLPPTNTSLLIGTTATATAHSKAIAGMALNCFMKIILIGCKKNIRQMVCSTSSLSARGFG